MARRGHMKKEVKELEELRQGYNIVGLSQVKNFISLAGPHAGTASVPLCGSGIFCVLANKLLKSEIYSDHMQACSLGSQRLYQITEYYLDKCKFLPKPNNEIPGERNSTYKRRFSSLEKMVLIMVYWKFEHDTVLIPKETSWFGYYQDDTFKSISSPLETKLYTEDWIGLRTLDEAGRVKYVSAHLGISTSDMKKHGVPYLKNSTSTKYGYVETGFAGFIRVALNEEEASNESVLEQG